MMTSRFCVFAAMFSALAQGALADAPATSLRPTPRPAVAEATDVVSRAATLDLRAPTSAVRPGAPTRTVRPNLRPAALKAVPSQTVPPEKAAGLKRWVAGFRTRALRAGINAAVFDRAMATARYRPDVIARDRNQSEFTKTLWDYLDSAVSDKRVRNGRAALRDHRALLDRIEARYGVEKEVVVAVWGMESAYGSFRGDTPVISALTTLAYDGRRGRFFEQQLLAALRILANGDTRADSMTGSWAGAMGHTQFIPTSFEALAVDFTGDGRRDIWGEDPADALASTANYLRKSGWRKDTPWGVEVRLPKGFDYSLARRDVTRMPSQWADLGVLDMSGKPVRDFGSASVLVPAGHKGAAFLIFRNFRAIERYNAANAYVIGVGHLSDRLAGAGPLQNNWPREDRALTRAERRELQRSLTARGFGTGGIDGRIGPKTTRAIRNFQKSRRLVPDGHPSLSLLARLR